MKSCNTCENVKPDFEFAPSKKSNDGLEGWCRECRNAYHRQYKRDNPQTTTPAQRSRTAIKYKYGLSDEALREIWAAQEGTCAGCKKPIPCESSTTTHIDHDHSCCPGVRTCGNCIRGLLCSGCNRVLSIVNDDTTRLSLLIQYLVDYDVKTTLAEFTA